MRKLYYGWVMVLLGASILATNALAFFGFGVFLKPLTAEFGWERGAISGAFAGGMLLAGVLSLFTGRLADRYGPRILVTIAGLALGTGFLLMSRIGALWQLYLIWGFTVGGAVSCSVPPINATIPRWFSEKRGIAVAIPLTGFSVGAIVSPLLAQWLVSAYGWRQSFLVLAFIPFIITLPLAQFLRHDPQQMGLRPYGEIEPSGEGQSLNATVGGISVGEAIKTGRFWAFAMLQFSLFFCVQVIIVHLVPHATDIGIPQMAAASTLSIIAAVSSVARLGVGLLADRIGGRRVLTFCLSQLALSLVWLLFARETWMFYLFAVVFGIAFGADAPLLAMVPVDLFGLKFLGSILGAGMFFGQLGGALGAPLAGRIFDVTGSYRVAFFISIALGLLAVILSVILLRYRGRGAIASK